MDRNHLFTVQSPDGQPTECALLAEAEIAPEGDAFKSKLEWAGVEASGSSEDEALQALLNELGGKINDEASGFKPTFEAYVAKHGRTLSAEEFENKQWENMQKNPLRTDLSPDEQYHIPILAEATMIREGDSVTIKMGLLDVEASGGDLNSASNAFMEKLNELTGDEANPGPQYETFAAYLREKGERIPLEQLKAEREQQAAYETAKDQIEEITPDQIEDRSSKGTPVVVDFWAPWCGPCRMITPVLAELQTEWAGKMAFAKINVDEHDGIWDRFGFKGIPCLILFKDGEEIHRVVGFGGREGLVAELEPHAK